MATIMWHITQWAGARLDTVMSFDRLVTIRKRAWVSFGSGRFTSIILEDIRFLNGSAPESKPFLRQYNLYLHMYASICKYASLLRFTAN